MDKVYIASCFTGAHCTSAYSTLEQACAAIENHYKALVMEAPGMVIESGMRWVKLHNDYAWVPDDFQAEQGNPWMFNNTPDGLMEACTVTQMDVDKALPFV